MCAKWQWNTRDCVTGLHDRRSRECNPVTPVEWVSRFYHTNWCKRNWVDFCLVNMIYFELHIFQIRNLLRCVDESSWNMLFKETRLGDGCGGRCCCYVTIVTECSSIVTSRSLNKYCDVTQCMNGLWIFIAKLASPKGDSQTWSSPPRNNGTCVIKHLLNPCRICRKMLVWVMTNSLAAAFSSAAGLPLTSTCQTIDALLPGFKIIIFKFPIRNDNYGTSYEIAPRWPSADVDRDLCHHLK